MRKADGAVTPPARTTVNHWSGRQSRQTDSGTPITQNQNDFGQARSNPPSVRFAVSMGAFQMNLFSIGKRFAQADEHKRDAAELKQEAESFNLAGDGGYIKWLKYSLFCLFGYYNARLFIVTVPGWEGYMTAVFALAGEATALYCINNYNRSSGKHQAALGVFGLLLTLFSVTHATISWFRMENHARLSSGIRFYCETVAFPLLFGLLLAAAIVIPFLHWRKKIATAQAKAAVEVASARAQLAANSAILKAEATMERERLESIEEKIQIGNEYVSKLQALAKMKEREREALNAISDPELRKQLASEFGITLDEPKPVAESKPVVRWQGGRVIDDQRGN